MTTDTGSHSQYTKVKNYREIDSEELLSSIKSILKQPVDDGALLNSLNRYTRRYLMNLNAASRAVIKDYGGSDYDCIRVEYESKKIADVTPSDKNISVVARVLTITRKIITSGDGSSMLFEVSAYDDTGEITINIWGNDPHLTEGNTYRFVDCWSKTYNGILYLNLNNSNLIQTEDDIDVPSHKERIVNESVKIGDIGGKGSIVTVCGTIVCITAKQFNNAITKKSGTRYCGKIRDGLSMIDFVSFNDPLLHEGEKVCLRKVVVDEFNGKRSLKMIAGSSIVRL